MSLAKYRPQNSEPTNSKEATAVTIDDCLQRFLVQLEADGRSPHTIGQYRRHVLLFAAWWRDVGPGGAIEEVSHEDVAQFLASPHARTRRDSREKKATSMNALRLICFGSRSEYRCLLRVRLTCCVCSNRRVDPRNA